MVVPASKTPDPSLHALIHQRAAPGVQGNLLPVLKQVQVAQRLGEAEEEIHAFEPGEEPATERVAIGGAFFKEPEQSGGALFVQFEPAFNQLAVALEGAP